MMRLVIVIAMVTMLVNVNAQGQSWPAPVPG